MVSPLFTPVDHGFPLGFLVAAAIVAQFSVRTRGRHYEEISP
jgi:hypothetical protein